MAKEKLVVCTGLGCPLRERCLRYDENFNPKKVDHLSSPPFRMRNGAPFCGHYIDNDLMKEVKKLIG